MECNLFGIWIAGLSTISVIAFNSSLSPDFLVAIVGITLTPSIFSIAFMSKGIPDISLELKWRFQAKNGWSFALKPGVTFPTGDNKKGLGSGRTTYSIFLIATKEFSPWAFHFNLGYTIININ